MGRVHTRLGLTASTRKRAKVTTAKLRMELGNTSNVKWFAGIGEYVIDWGPGYRIYLAKDGDSLIVLIGGGTKRRRQTDIDRAKALHAEYKARKPSPPVDRNAGKRKRRLWRSLAISRRPLLLG